MGSNNGLSRRSVNCPGPVSPWEADVTERSGDNETPTITPRPGTPVVLCVRHRDSGIIELTGRATRFPGLVATHNAKTGKWTLTQYRSGLTLGWKTPDPECIMRFAEAIGPWADWTLPADDPTFIGSGITERIAVVAIALGLTDPPRGSADYSDVNDPRAIAS